MQVTFIGTTEGYGRFKFTPRFFDIRERDLEDVCKLYKVPYRLWTCPCCNMQQAEIDVTALDKNKEHYERNGVKVSTQEVRDHKKDEIIEYIQEVHQEVANELAESELAYLMG